MKTFLLMKTKLPLLIILFATITTAGFSQFRQDSRDEVPQNYFKVGTQVPFQHSIMFEKGITSTFGINAGVGLVASPYTSVIFNTLENKGLVSSNEKNILSRSYRMGVTYQLGANF